MTQRRRLPKPAVTDDLLISHALDLTAAQGLAGWSMRDLSRATGASPSSIYHHVGGKDALAERLVQRVLDAAELPAADLDWRGYFTVVCGRLFDLVVPYPGVAHWMTMHGPVFTQMLPFLDRGITLLKQARLEPAGVVYSLIFNGAISVIVLSDERQRHADDGPRDHQHIVDRLDAIDDGNSVGIRELRPVIAGFVSAPRPGRLRSYFDTTVQVLLDGVESRFGGHRQP